MKNVKFTVILLLFSLLPCFGANTTVVQTVNGPDGSLASGTATIRISAACRNGSNYVGQKDITVNFTNGAFSKALVPTDACVTSGSVIGLPWSSLTTYAVGDRATFSAAVFQALLSSLNVTPGTDKTKWAQVSPTYHVIFKLITGPIWEEDWAVPTSGVPVTIDSVRIAVPPPPLTLATGAKGAGYYGTSTTSRAVTVGAVTITTQSGLAYIPGDCLLLVSSGAPANFMVGPVTAYNSATGSLSFTASSLVASTCSGIGGSATRSDWNLSLIGLTGPTAPNNANGAISFNTATNSCSVTVGGSSCTANGGTHTVSWTHSLNLSPTTAYLLECFDNSSVAVIPNSFSATDANTISIVFAIDQQGACTLNSGAGPTGAQGIQGIQGSTGNNGTNGTGYTYRGVYSGRPGSPTLGDTMLFEDATNTGICTAGNFGSGGTNFSSCVWSGSAFVKATSGVPIPSTTNLLAGDGSGGVVAGIANVTYVTPASIPASQSSTGFVPYQYWPHLMAGESGTGADSSHRFTNSNDSNGGLGTAADTAKNNRGGAVRIAAGEYLVTNEISLATKFYNSITFFGEGMGYNAQPNGTSEGQTGTKLKRTTNGRFFVWGDPAGDSGSNRPGGLTIRDVSMDGNSPNFNSTESCIYVQGYADQGYISHVNCRNSGAGVYINNADAITVDVFTCQDCGRGLYMANFSACWGCKFSNLFMGDSNQVPWLGASGYDNNQISFVNMNLYRNCLSGGCEAGNFYFGDRRTKVSNLTSEDGGSNTASAEIVVAGDDFEGSNFVIRRGTKTTGYSGLLITGNRVNIGTIELFNVDTGITISGSNAQITGINFHGTGSTAINMSGNDNHVSGNFTACTDSGSRNFCNGVSKNAGDPDAAGVWNGVTKPPGAIIRDTTNNITYFYWDSTHRSTMTN